VDADQADPVVPANADGNNSDPNMVRTGLRLKGDTSARTGSRAANDGPLMAADYDSGSA